jgi:hypothetical protein
VNVQATDVTPGAYTFGIHAENTQAGIIHEQQVTLNVVDFQLGAPSPLQLTIPDGGSSTFSFQVTAAGPFNSSLSLVCIAIPGVTCQFSPSATITPTASVPVNVTVTVNISPKTAPGPYTLEVQTQANGIFRKTALSLTIAANPDFLLLPSSTAVGADAANPSLVNVVVDQQDGYTGNVQLGCTVVPAGPTCTIAPSPVATFPQTAVLSIAANNAALGRYQITVTGSDGTRTHSFVVNYGVGAYTITGPASIATFAALRIRESSASVGQGHRTRSFRSSASRRLRRCVSGRRVSLPQRHPILR